MRTEQEIREAMELCQSAKLTKQSSIEARDATVETLRYCLGIDDNETSPMTHSLKELLDGMKEGRAKPCKTNQGSESVVTE